MFEDRCLCGSVSANMMLGCFSNLRQLGHDLLHMQFQLQKVNSYGKLCKQKKLQLVDSISAQHALYIHNLQCRHVNPQKWHGNLLSHCVSCSQIQVWSRGISNVNKCPIQVKIVNWICFFGGELDNNIAFMIIFRKIQTCDEYCFVGGLAVGFNSKQVDGRNNLKGQGVSEAPCRDQNRRLFAEMNRVSFYDSRLLRSRTNKYLFHEVVRVSYIVFTIHRSFKAVSSI